MAPLEQQMFVYDCPLTVPLSQAGKVAGHWLFVGVQEMGTAGFRNVYKYGLPPFVHESVSVKDATWTTYDVS